MSIDNKLEKLIAAVESMAESQKAISDVLEGLLAKMVHIDAAVHPVEEAEAPVEPVPETPDQEPAVPDFSGTPEVTMTEEDLNNFLIAKAQTIDPAKIFEIINTMGATGVSQLKPEQYSELIAKVEAL